LEEPARRVAEIVEALEPVLMPPPVVAAARGPPASRPGRYGEITTKRPTCGRARSTNSSAANEKGLELAIGPVKAFFHRPWKTVCNFLAEYQPRDRRRESRLSALAGAWEGRGAARRREGPRGGARRSAAERATARGGRRAGAGGRGADGDRPGPRGAGGPADDHVAEILEHAATQVQRSSRRAFTRRRRAARRVQDRNWVARSSTRTFFKGLADGTIPRTYVTIEQGKLDRQACDLKGELEKMYPGIKVVEVPGIAAKGGRGDRPRGLRPRHGRPRAGQLYLGVAIGQGQAERMTARYL
jgi:hypothetical protein